jgi:acyl-CoA-binding protein
MKGKAKHDAWTARKGMPQEEAMQKYIDLTKSMMEKHGTIN